MNLLTGFFAASALAVSCIPNANAIGDSGGCSSFDQTPIGQATVRGTSVDLESTIQRWLDYQEQIPHKIGNLAALGEEGRPGTKWRIEQAKRLIEGRSHRFACPHSHLLPLAMNAGNLDVVRFLLAKPLGVDLTITAQTINACGVKRHLSEEQRIRRRQAYAMVLDTVAIDLNAPVWDSDTRIIQSCVETDLLELFVEHGARVDIANEWGSAIAITKKLNLLELAIWEALYFAETSSSARDRNGLERARFFSTQLPPSLRGSPIEEHVRLHCTRLGGRWETCKALAMFIDATPGTFPEEIVTLGQTRVIVPRNHPRRTDSVAPKPGCEFPKLKLPSNFLLAGAGAYEGRSMPFQIDQSGDSAYQIDVVVNSIKKPVVLLLGAYKPTIWNISWSKGTDILAVLASGHGRQAVAGLGKKVPQLNSSYHNKGPCGYFYVEENEIHELDQMAKRVFGRPVEMVFLADKGSVTVGEPLHANTELVSSPETLPASFYNNEAPIAGQAGLIEAIRKGVLRRATLVDTHDWSDAIMRNSPGRTSRPVAGNLTRPIESGYVVLRSFTYPPGINLQVFVIPKGVLRPNGDPGNSTIYDFNTLTCKGFLCGYR